MHDDPPLQILPAIMKSKPGLSLQHCASRGMWLAFTLIELLAGLEMSATPVRILETVGSTMKWAHLMRRLANSCGSAAVGAMGGALLAAFGSVVSNSTAGVVTTIALATALGAGVGLLPGAVGGIGCGGLIVVFGSVIGGSATGVMFTILGCALLAGYLTWWSPPRGNDNAASVESGFGLDREFDDFRARHWPERRERNRNRIEKPRSHKSHKEYAL